MMLPDMFLQLVLQMGASMTTPTLGSLVTVVKGWLFAGRHTLTGVLVAVGGSGSKHHLAYYRLFAAARWSLDALGLDLFHLIPKPPPPETDYDHTHAGCVPHWHYYEYNQNPETCQCFGPKRRFGGCGVAPAMP